MKSQQSIFGAFGGAAKYLLVGASVAALATVVANAQDNDVNGEVDVVGHVTGICFVQDGEEITNSFSGTIDLGELAGPDGKLDPALTGSVIPGASLSFTVVCNSATPGVSLSATQMVGDAATVFAGYTKNINYTARLDLELGNGSTQTFNYATAGSPPATTGNLATALSGNADNVTVSVNSLASNGNLLAAGYYGEAAGGSGGVISITISPT